MKGQLIGAPIMTAFIVFVGICGTSGSELAFGEAFWDPSILVSHFGNPAVVIIFSLFIILATLDHERSLQPGGPPPWCSPPSLARCSPTKGRRGGHDPLHLLPALETG